jgi:hypothetical protein
VVFILGYEAHVIYNIGDEVKIVCSDCIREGGTFGVTAPRFLTSALMSNINSYIFVGGKLCVIDVGFITPTTDTLLQKFRCYETSWFP